MPKTSYLSPTPSYMYTAETVLVHQINYFKYIQSLGRSLGPQSGSVGLIKLYAAGLQLSAAAVPEFQSQDTPNRLIRASN